MSANLDELVRVLESMDDKWLAFLAADLKWYRQSPVGVYKTAVDEKLRPSDSGYHLKPLIPWLVATSKPSIMVFPDDVLSLIDTYVALRLSP